MTKLFDQKLLHQGRMLSANRVNGNPAAVGAVWGRHKTLARTSRPRRTREWQQCFFAIGKHHQQRIGADFTLLVVAPYLRPFPGMEVGGVAALAPDGIPFLWKGRANVIDGNAHD